MTALPGSHDGDVGLPDYVGGWMAHGHPGYHGYAWYRRAVAVPAGRASWDILGPTLVEDGYELYWNGQLLGGSGRLGSASRVVGTRPLRFALPTDAAGTQGVLAVRAYKLPGSRGQRRRRRHAQRAHTGSAANKRCASPRAMGANHRRLHRRSDRADRHVGSHRLDARVPISQQPQSFPDLRQYRACAHGNQEAEQCDRRMDRPDGSAYLFVAGVMDVGANCGLLDLGLEPMAPACVAHHRCIGCREYGNVQLWSPRDYNMPLLVIPYRDDKGRIQACQLRLHRNDIRAGEKKYRWLACPFEFRGASSGTPIHFTFKPATLTPGGNVIITEGALKAQTLVSLRPKARVIATSGVSCSHAEIIAASRAYNALIAFDADYKTNAAVARQLARLIAAREQDIAPHHLKTTTRIVTWQRYKGIDDAVLAGVSLRTMTILKWISTLDCFGRSSLLF